MRKVIISGENYACTEGYHAEFVTDKITKSDNKVTFDVEYLDKQTWVWDFIGYFFKNQNLLDIFVDNSIGANQEFRKYTLSSIWYNRGDKKMYISFRAWDEVMEDDPSEITRV